MVVVYERRLRGGVESLLRLLELLDLDLEEASSLPPLPFLPLLAGDFGDTLGLLCSGDDASRLFEGGGGDLLLRLGGGEFLRLGELLLSRRSRFPLLLFSERRRSGVRERDLDLDDDLDRLEFCDLDRDLLLGDRGGLSSIRSITRPFNSVWSSLSMARSMSSRVAKSTTPSFWRCRLMSANTT